MPADLLYDAQVALHTTQAGLGEMLGVSRRTAQRWTGGGSVPSKSLYAKLASLLHPVDAGLAGRAAMEGGTTLEALGLAAGAAQPAALPPAVAPEHLVDSVVCAASEAMGVLPGEIRPALLAAFARARAIGVTLEGVERVLRGAGGEARGAKGAKGKG